MGRLRHDIGRLREKTRKHRRVMAAVGVVALVAVACKPALTGPTTGPIHFESSDNPPYQLGTIDGQNGWTSAGAAGGGCGFPYDHKVSDGSESATTPASHGFGTQSLRMSDAVTSGCFDQTYSAPTTDESG
ncbi:MAG: hypothetical protein QOF28_2791, partial [Actinomycetota bacterium]|nr:hypothetical protein [Actinomycetota bacterium]